MKLNKITVDILKNFATINQGLLFRPGNQLKTMNIQRSMFVSATIPDEIPQEFAIYDLNEFLAAYSLIENCDIAFEEKKMILSNGNQKTYYYYSSPSIVVSPGDKTINFPSEDKTFLFSKEILEMILKNSSVMKLKDLNIDCNDITVLNRNNPTGNQYIIDVPIDCQNETLKTSYLKVDNLKLIPVDYDVAICEKGMARFVSRSEDYQIQYFIALDSEG